MELASSAGPDKPPCPLLVTHGGPHARTREYVRSDPWSRAGAAAPREAAPGRATPDPALGADTRAPGFAAECRRQSLMLRDDPQEAEVLGWIEAVSDTTDWR